MAKLRQLQAGVWLGVSHWSRQLGMPTGGLTIFFGWYHPPMPPAKPPSQPHWRLTFGTVEAETDAAGTWVAPRAQVEIVVTATTG